MEMDFEVIEISHHCSVVMSSNMGVKRRFEGIWNLFGFDQGLLLFFFTNLD